MGKEPNPFGFEDSIDSWDRTHTVIKEICIMSNCVTLVAYKQNIYVCSWASGSVGWYCLPKKRWTGWIHVSVTRCSQLLGKCNSVDLLSSCLCNLAFETLSRPTSSHVSFSQQSSPGVLYWWGRTGESLSSGLSQCHFWHFLLTKVTRQVLI